MRATERKAMTEPTRQRELRKILLLERDRLLDSVRLTIREGREEGAIESHEVQDEAEDSEADIQSELEFALLEMQGETLRRIGDALDRLDEGSYGLCSHCGAEISARRLEALPFATRCRGCEQAHEKEDRNHASPASWRGAAELLRMDG